MSSSSWIYLTRHCDRQRECCVLQYSTHTRSRIRMPQHVLEHCMAVSNIADPSFRVRRAGKGWTQRLFVSSRESKSCRGPKQALRATLRLHVARHRRWRSVRVLLSRRSFCLLNHRLCVSKGSRVAHRQTYLLCMDCQSRRRIRPIAQELGPDVLELQYQWMTKRISRLIQQRAKGARS